MLVKGGALPRLTIDGLDEISLGIFSHVPRVIESHATNELIPFAEWHWLKAAGHTLPELRGLEGVASLQRALKTNANHWVDPVSKRSGFIRVRRNHSDVEDLPWVAFLLALSKAAEDAGLTKMLASQLAGVTQEMEDNVHWHSARPRSGLVAFLSANGTFEFVTLDTGRGVLASLREAEEFSSLDDHGMALRAAIDRGNSRFGTGTGRGWGFNDLVIGVANANARIRFRSGDYLLELDGTSAQIVSREAQRAEARGFMVAVRAQAG